MGARHAGAARLRSQTSCSPRRAASSPIPVSFALFPLFLMPAVRESTPEFGF